MAKQQPVTVRYADGTTKVVRADHFRKKRFNYRQYRKSKHWRNLRLKVLNRDDHRCVLCRSTEHLEVHHLTYERLYREELSDLTTLCRRCHATEHQWKRRRWIRGLET